MAEDIKNVNVEEEEEDIITLEFDDDTAVDCYVLGTFELNDKEYIALMYPCLRRERPIR